MLPEILQRSASLAELHLPSRRADRAGLARNSSHGLGLVTPERGHGIPSPVLPVRRHRRLSPRAFRVNRARKRTARGATRSVPRPSGGSCSTRSVDESSQLAAATRVIRSAGAPCLFSHQCGSPERWNDSSSMLQGRGTGRLASSRVHCSATRSESPALSILRLETVHGCADTRDRQSVKRSGEASSSHRRQTIQGKPRRTLETNGQSSMRVLSKRPGAFARSCRRVPRRLSSKHSRA